MTSTSARAHPENVARRALRRVCRRRNVSGIAFFTGTDESDAGPGRISSRHGRRRRVVRSDPEGVVPFFHVRLDHFRFVFIPTTSARHTRRDDVLHAKPPSGETGGESRLRVQVRTPSFIPRNISFCGDVCCLCPFNLFRRIFVLAERLFCVINVNRPSRDSVY